MRTLLAFLFLLFASSGAFAQVLPSGCYADDDYFGMGSDHLEESSATCTAPTGSASGGDGDFTTRAFVGVSVPLGEDFNPHIVAGVQALKFTGDVTVVGVEANITMSLRKWLEDTQVHLLAVGGYSGDNLQLLGNAGFGFDLASQSFVLTGGVQVPFARAYADLGLNDQQLRIFLELNSLAKLSPEQSALACSEGTLMNAAEALEKFVGDFYRNPTAYSGDIFDGSVNADPLPFALDFEGTASDAWVGGETGVTCFNSNEGEVKFPDAV